MLALLLPEYWGKFIRNGPLEEVSPPPPCGPDFTPCGPNFTPCGPDFTPRDPDFTPCGPVLTSGRALVIPPPGSASPSLPGTIRRSVVRRAEQEETLCADVGRRAARRSRDHLQAQPAVNPRALREGGGGCRGGDQSDRKAGGLAGRNTQVTERQPRVVTKVTQSGPSDRKAGGLARWRGGPAGTAGGADT
eukprot:1175578-Prorocentrum_minimum.AAC.3